MEYKQIMEMLQKDYLLGEAEARRLVHQALDNRESFFTRDGQRYRISRTLAPDSWKIQAV